MIIWDKNFEYRIHGVQKDHEGRFIILELELLEVAKFLLVNV